MSCCCRPRVAACHRPRRRSGDHAHAGTSRQKSEFIDGQRVTGAAEMGVVEMVLTGKVNTEIVGLINTFGGSAMGMSGKDAHLIRARKQIPRPGTPDLGLVGEVESINAEVVEMLLDKKYIPVISPVGLGVDGSSYNIKPAGATPPPLPLRKAAGA